MKMAKIFQTAAFAAGLLTLSSSAFAVGFINGYGWTTTNADSMSATAATLASAGCNTANGLACTDASLNPISPDVSFTTNTVNFNTGLNTIADFLASDGVVGAAFANGVTGATHMSDTGVDGTLWLLTGTATFATGESFTLSHDDGVTFIVNGTTVFADSGPTSVKNSTFTYSGAPGSFTFDIIYGECCNPPAVLQTSFGSVPEPRQLGLLLVALLGAVIVLRRKFASTAA